jgi:hypothetical protein
MMMIMNLYHLNYYGKWEWTLILKGHQVDQGAAMMPQLGLVQQAGLQRCARTARSKIQPEQQIATSVACLYDRYGSHTHIYL